MTEAELHDLLLEYIPRPEGGPFLIPAPDVDALTAYLWPRIAGEMQRLRDAVEYRDRVIAESTERLVSMTNSLRAVQ